MLRGGPQALDSSQQYFLTILQLIPRLEFESAVCRRQAERHARGFSCWGQFIAMLFCQLGHAKSLREICGGLWPRVKGKLRRLGLPTAPARSTLAYANEPSALAAAANDLGPTADKVPDLGGRPTRERGKEEEVSDSRILC